LWMDTNSFGLKKSLFNLWPGAPSNQASVTSARQGSGTDPAGDGGKSDG
jgi:hypothetical protein